MPANDASRSPGRPRGGDSACRGRLLEAAMEAFARSGYDGASLRAIALAADCDVSMVAHYFGSKAELWRAMVDELAQRHQADRAEIARSLAEPGVAVEARVRRGAGLLFDRIARQAPLARLLMREAAETGERATYVLTQLMQPNLELYRPLWEEAMDAGILGRSDVVVAHTALVGAIASVISMRVSIARLSGREMELATLRDEFLDVLMRHGPQGASPTRKGSRSESSSR